jgi:ABC-2 type transport system ATP-binding protein
MLEFAGISKLYASEYALRNVAFSVNNGEMVAVVGPNGAGKSTLVNIAAGMIAASAGICRLDSLPLASLEQQALGFLPEAPFFYQTFTASETIQFEQTMRNVQCSKSELEGLEQSFGITDFLNIRMDSLSNGMAKRVALVCAFIGNPQVIVLDEPLNGLDIQSVINLKEQLLLQKERGAHILISSHVLTFLDGLVNRVIFLDRGNLVYESNDTDDIENAYKSLFCC